MYETKEGKEIRAKLEDTTIEIVRLQNNLESVEKKILKLPYKQLEKLRPLSDKKFKIKSRLDYLEEQRKRYINLLNMIR